MDACAAYAAEQHLGVTIPRSKPGLSTARVLTMDWLQGRSLRADLELRYAGALAGSALLRPWRLLRLRGRARRALRLVARAQGAMIFGRDSPGFTADPHPGNVLILEDGRVFGGVFIAYARRTTHAGGPRGLRLPHALRRSGAAAPGRPVPRARRGR